MVVSNWNSYPIPERDAQLCDVERSIRLAWPAFACWDEAAAGLLPAGCFEPGVMHGSTLAFQQNHDGPTTVLRRRRSGRCVVVGRVSC